MDDVGLMKQKSVIIRYALGIFLVLGLAVMIVSSLIQFEIREVQRNKGVNI